MFISFAFEPFNRSFIINDDELGKIIIHSIKGGNIWEAIIKVYMDDELIIKNMIKCWIFLGKHSIKEYPIPEPYKTNLLNSKYFTLM